MQVSLGNQEDTDYPLKESLMTIRLTAFVGPWFHTKLGVLSEVRLYTDDQTAGITAVAPSPQML